MLYHLEQNNKPEVPCYLCIMLFRGKIRIFCRKMLDDVVQLCSDDVDVKKRIKLPH